MQTRNSVLSRPVVMVAVAAVSCLLWASASPMIKIGYGLFGLSSQDVPSMLVFAGIRFTLAGILVLLFAALSAHSFPKATPWNALKLGSVQTLGQYLPYYIGVATASAVNVSVLNGMGYLWAILFACYLFRREKMTSTKTVACLLGLSGVIVMNLGGDAARFTLMGEGMVILSTMLSGVASGLAKGYMEKDSSVPLTGWQFVCGGMMLLLVGLVMGGRLAFGSIGCYGVILYLGSLSAIAYTLWNTLIRFNDVSRVSICGFMNPMFGVFVSAALLREFDRALRPNVLCALLLVCLAVIAVNLKGEKR